MHGFDVLRLWENAKVNPCQVVLRAGAVCAYPLGAHALLAGAEAHKVTKQDEEEIMAAFVRESMQRKYPFRKEVQISADMLHAVNWINERTPEEVRRWRRQCLAYSLLLRLSCAGQCGT